MPLPLSGYQSLGQMIQNRLNQGMQNRLQQEQVKNALIKNKYAEPEIQANIANKMAQTNRQNELLKQPFAGRAIPGAGGEALGLEMLKNEYGENSPVYQNALNTYESDRRQANQLMNYRKALEESLPKRTATPLAKTAMEERDIEQGFLPGTNEKLSPERQKQLSGRFELKNVKDTTDTKTRERMLYAQNIEKTISNIEPKYLLQYSGPTGALKYKKDKYLSALGVNVPEFYKFEESVTAAHMLGEQVRQFYGTSIQPSVREDLNKLGNPSYWLRDPKVAEKKYNKYVKILNSEIDTFASALKDAGIYKNSSLISNAAKVTNQPHESLVQPKFPKNLEDPLGIR